jgi:hypothetical protein
MIVLSISQVFFFKNFNNLQFLKSMSKKQQELTNTELYQNQLGKLYSFKNQKARYRKHYYLGTI